MTNEDIFEALGDLPADLVEESRPGKKKPAPLWVKWAAPVAAVLVIGVGVGLLFGRGNIPGEPAFPAVTATETAGITSTSADEEDNPTDPVTEPTDPVTEPAETVTRPTETATVPAPTDPTGTKPVTAGTDPAPTGTKPPPLPEQPEALKNMALAQAVYPETVKYPTVSFGTPGFTQQYTAWDTARRERFNTYRPNRKEERAIAGFFAKTAPAILAETGGHNRVYSPLNAYMALSMLAETGEGNTRDQVLALLGTPSLDQLRETVSDLWNAAYRDDGAGTLIPANSLWLRNDRDYRMETVDTLKKTYYASTFAGVPGTEEFDGALQTWVNQQTGGLLKNQVGRFRSNDLLSCLIASTLYFKENWRSEFKTTESGIFHGTDGDRTVTMMKETQESEFFYWGERFTAVKKRYDVNGSMTFLLPDEGYTPEDLLKDPETISFLSETDWDNMDILTIHLTLPKFDVSSDLDLVKQIRSLGVTDCFDRDKADFSALSDESGIAVERILHAARVTVDEKGTEAASYVLIMAGATAPPPVEVEEIDFTLDRPFIFLISDGNGLPLFVGIVNQV